MYILWKYICFFALFVLAFSYGSTDAGFEILSQKVTPLSEWRNDLEFQGIARGNRVNNVQTSFKKLFSAIKQETTDFNLDIDFPVEVTRLYLYARDGVRLSTIIINTPPFAKPKTMLFSRSPYGPTSDQMVDLFLSASKGKFVGVIQDQRGTFLSGGKFNLWKNESTDAYDTMNIFAKHPAIFPWFNGTVFSTGISADGCSAVTQVLARPKWLKGQYIVWATGDSHDTLYPGGSFREGLVTGWMTLMGLLTDGVSLKETLLSIKQHEAMSQFYKMISMDNHARDVNFVSVHLSGWWDIFNSDHIKLFNEYREHSRMTVRDKHRLVVGPLGHCTFHEIPRLELMRPILRHEVYGWIVSLRQALALFSGKIDELEGFHRVILFVQGPYHHKKDNTRLVSDEPNSFLSFPTEDEGNFWVGFEEWPSNNIENYYISDSGKLEADHYEVVDGSKSFIYDPESPTVTDGGNNFIIDVMGYRCGSQDQIFFETRPDTITFTSSMLDKSIGVCGKVTSTLFVSSDRVDTDFVGTLTDVYLDLDGKEKSMLVRRGIQNMKWRSSKTEPELMEKGKKYEVQVEMGYTCYVFNKGHRIRFSIASSNWPMYAVNKNNLSKKGFEFLNNEDLQNQDIIEGEWKGYSPLDESWRETGLRAENTVYFSEDMPSRISLPIVDVDKLRKSKLTLV